MPFSRSRSLESITRSVTTSLVRKTPAWRSMWSTRVVFPWSTCATMATLRMFSREIMGEGPFGAARRAHSARPPASATRRHAAAAVSTTWRIAPWRTSRLRGLLTWGTRDDRRNSSLRGVKAPPVMKIIRWA